MDSDDEPITNFERDQMVRIVAQNVSSKADDEYQKVVRGIVSNEALDTIINELETTGVEGSRSARAFHDDGEAFKRVSQLTMAQFLTLRDQNVKTVDADLFATKLKEHANNCAKKSRSNSTSVFALMSNEYKNILGRVPDFHLMRPFFQLNANIDFIKHKKERNRVQRRAKTAAEVIKGRNAQQNDKENEEDDDATLSKELVIIYRQLRNFWKDQNETYMGLPNSVNYYRFVINPHDFAETIENMFYVAFLVKEGMVKLHIDNETGMPAIVKISTQQRTAYKVNKNQFETKQVISTFDYETYQNIIGKFEISEPMIKRIAPND